MGRVRRDRLDAVRSEQSHELRAKERSMIRIYLAIPALVTLFGCVANDDSSAHLSSVSSAEAQAGCDPDLPPCECTFKGYPFCADPDNDGVPNIDDDCPFTYNPGQENCDGDASGDVCDSDNAIL